MACYQKHDRRNSRLDLLELNRVLRAVGFAKFHKSVKFHGDNLPLPKAPAVPRKSESAPPKDLKRGQPEPGSLKQTLQASISQSRLSSLQHPEQPLQTQQTLPPPPPTLHLHADTINRLAQKNGELPRRRIPRPQQEREEVDAEEVPQRSRPPTRKGDGDSYRVNKAMEIDVPILAAHRCYRILTYDDTAEGRVVFDILTGTEYYCRSGPNKRRITPSVVVFTSRQEALSERFPTHDGRMSMPRILVRFDAWGRCRKRYGGGGSSAVYEYVKFLGIVQFLDAPSTISKKQVEHPIHPHDYPRADKPIHVRRIVDRRIRVDKNFDITPWRK